MVIGFYFKLKYTPKDTIEKNLLSGSHRNQYIHPEQLSRYTEMKFILLSVCYEVYQLSQFWSDFDVRR